MRSFLKRLLGKAEQPDLMADYATDEWAPVPVSAAAPSANVMGWLTEPSLMMPPRRRVPSTGRIRRHTIRRMVKKLKGYMDHLSPEERAIVEEQQSQREDDPTLPRAVEAAKPAPAPAVTPEPAPTDEKWVHVVKTYGEHLTNEELQIIYRQLS
jgi:hypothetical protein